MGIGLTSNFTENAPLPLDDRSVVADIAARDAIDAGRRYEGMLVFVESEGTNYQLVGGIDNTDWVELSGGSSGAWSVDNVLLVDSVEDEIVGKRYQSIANALAYAATQTPTTDNRWTVLVGGTNSENFTLPAWVRVVGIGNNAVLEGTITSGAVSGDFTARTIKGCVVKDISVASGHFVYLEECTVDGGTCNGNHIYKKHHNKRRNIQRVYYIKPRRDKRRFS